MKIFRGNAKLVIGIFISLIFMYLALRKVDFYQMGSAFTEANYWYIIPAVSLLFISHWFRAVRWHYLLVPIQSVEIKPLFSALMIGYLANIILPAHLGELLRAFVLGKKRQVPSSAVFGTIVVERIIDVFTLLLLMALTFITFPFPDWVTKSGYITFIGALGLIVMLVLMKRHRDISLRLLSMFLKPFPEKISNKVNGLYHSFLDGVVGLDNWRHYIITTVLSLVIWFCYGAIFHVCFYAFSFIGDYNLPWNSSLVTLVITSISVLVPSSPGYVGTYHYLCLLALGLFGVPDSQALTFAFVVHGINFVPILIVGLLIAGVEGINISKVSRQAAEEDKDTC